HHPTNKLIGRGLIPHRYKRFPPPGHATSRVYSVLDPVSQAYPKVQGRSPTCYSPVRHSSTPEGAFPYDLHVLSTPPAFVLSQDQTLQKNPDQNPKTKGPKHAKNHKNKPHTLLSSQTSDTHPKLACGPVSRGDSATLAGRHRPLQPRAGDSPTPLTADRRPLVRRHSAACVGE